MRKFVRSFRILVTVLAALVALSTGEGVIAHTVRESARLRGDKEVPGPGDPNGRGKARFRINDEKNKLCYRISYRTVPKVTAAHIHQGGPKESGPVIVFLSDGPDVESPMKGCVNDVKRADLRRIQRHPRRFYVNLHSEEYPDGAIRGQLRR